MIGLYNADSSFFNVSSDDLNLEQKEHINEDIISLSITEEIAKAASGSLSLYDPENIYPTLFHVGAKLKISWGYKDVDTNIRTVLAKSENTTEVDGTLIREGMTGFIMSPSGGGNEGGVSTFHCNFYGSEWSKQGNRKVYTKGTYSSVINEVMTRMGVSQFIVMFTKGNTMITEDTQVLQWENDIRFLQRISREWGCIFRIGYMSNGQLYGLFVDHDKFHMTQFNKIVTGASFGNSVQLDYKKGLANVISYTWQNHAGESGTGDHVKLVVINGQTTFVRYVAEGDKVLAYRFCPEKISNELKRKNKKGGISSMNDYMKWAMNVQDFNELIRDGYFVPYEEKTAPQGLGYSASVQLLGNPLITTPLIAKFGKGFPDCLSNNKIGFFFTRVEHTINKDGYKINGEIMDTLAYTGGSFII